MSGTRRLAGRRALIVGSSRGIGRAIGIGLSLEGASVAFAARTREKLDAAVAECAGPAIAIECDVRDEASCRAAVDATVAAFGGLDVLVYSAGMSVFRDLAEATADDWRLVLDTNVVGAALVTAAAVEHLKAAAGNAIYLSSESTLYNAPWKGIGMYIASKRAMESMIASFHVEVPEVAFTTYVVGATMSEFGSDQADEMGRYLTEWFERGEVTTDILVPETHAKAVVDILTTDALVHTVAVRVRGIR